MFEHLQKKNATKTTFFICNSKEIFFPGSFHSDGRYVNDVNLNLLAVW